jgi:hypothetical protein
MSSFVSLSLSPSLCGFINFSVMVLVLVSMALSLGVQASEEVYDYSVYSLSWPLDLYNMRNYLCIANMTFNALPFNKHLFG